MVVMHVINDKLIVVGNGWMVGTMDGRDMLWPELYTISYDK